MNKHNRYVHVLYLYAYVHVIVYSLTLDKCCFLSVYSVFGTCELLAVMHLIHSSTLHVILAVNQVKNSHVDRAMCYPITLEVTQKNTSQSCLHAPFTPSDKASPLL